MIGGRRSIARAVIGTSVTCMLAVMPSFPFFLHVHEFLEGVMSWRGRSGPKDEGAPHPLISFSSSLVLAVINARSCEKGMRRGSL